MSLFNGRDRESEYSCPYRFAFLTVQTKQREPREAPPGRAFPTKYNVFYVEIPFLCETFVK